MMRKMTRRRFIALGATGIMIAAGGVARYIIHPGTSPRGANTIQSTAAPHTGPGNAKFPAADLPLALWITANEDFYVVQYDLVPSVSLTSWSLTIHGLVRETLRLSLDELRALPTATEMHTLECIGNPAGGNLIGNANWRGIPLRTLLDRAGVDPRATHLTIGGVDEYLTSIPLATGMHEHALLAYEMNGQPLPAQHGYPLRLILPGVYGQKQPKWVTGIKVTDTIDLGPWEQKGWSNEATIRLNSGIKLPVEGAPVSRGDLLIAGVAYSGADGVSGVQISTDGGKSWHDTALTRGPSPFVWTEWGYWFRQPPPGEYHLMVRAIDNSGHPQDQSPSGILSGVFPNGTSEIHNMVVQIRDS